MNNKGADQSARMRRLICAFVVRKWHKTHFRTTWPSLISIYTVCPGLSVPILRIITVIFSSWQSHSFQSKYIAQELSSFKSCAVRYICVHKHDQESGYCDWVWYHVMGHDTSEKQHYKSEHCAPCRNQTPS